ncbi:MAG: prepilin-type N-terminal cleavage/methylation domain-containing protein [Lachnospiraceae bacterium]|nr:prepilin-type N-terminal cleavage/methylation domain-containing protein [Lachnospiraceae bacterium]
MVLRNLIKGFSLLEVLIALTIL